jgi:hypothetical protein
MQNPIPTAKISVNFELVTSMFESNVNTCWPINFAMIEEKWMYGPALPKI